MGLENTGRKKIGLALGSGVARGLAHIGVLRVLEKEGIHIDMVAGTSIGAIVGAFYAMGKTTDEMLKIAKKVGAHPFNYLVDLSIPKTGLIKGRKIEKWLKEFYGNTEFKDCIIPFKCVATDIDTGKEVVLDKGPLWESVRASISMPIILEIAVKEGKSLVDGALVNPVPVNIVRQMGADIVIAVNVEPDRNTNTMDHHFFDVVMQTLHIVGYYVVKDSLEGSEIVLEPDVSGIPVSDFQRVDEYVEKGMIAATEALPRIREIIGDMTGVSNERI